MARVFFRLVGSRTPTLADVLSKSALGEPLRVDTPENRRLCQGISVYATEAQARRKGRASPMLGAYIARIELPDDGPIESERTTTSSGHHTLWGDPLIILAAITDVVAVSPRREPDDQDL
jgi:hypothetical protein